MSYTLYFGHNSSIDGLQSRLVHVLACSAHCVFSCNSHLLVSFPFVSHLGDGVTVSPSLTCVFSGAKHCTV